MTGINVAIATVAALALVILVNFIAYRQYVRFDFTQTGMYSLSPQTRQVLEDLKGEHEIVGIFAINNQPAVQLAELLDEYGRRSSELTTTRIDPQIDAVQLDAFMGRLAQRYADRVEPATELVRGVLEQMEARLGQLTPVLSELKQRMEAQSLTGRSAAQLQQVVSVLPQLPASWEQGASTWRQEMEAPLPPIGALTDEILSVLEQMNGNTLTTANAWLDEAGADPSLPPDVRDASLRASAALEGLRDFMGEQIDALAQVGDLEDYDQLVSDLVNRECVVVLTDDKARVIERQAMIDAERLSEENKQETQYRFQAEEKITGALISLSMDQNPLAVFVILGPGRPPIDEGGEFAYVASRLRSAGFELTTWSPSAQMTPYGQQIPPQPAPQPKAGQPTVWVILPAPPPDPRNPMAGGAAAAKQTVAELLKRRLAEGDGALLMLGTDPSTRFGTTDPLADLSTSWGMTPKLEQMVVRELRQGERQTQPTTMHELRVWPTDHVISKAIGGLPGIMFQASPIELTDPSKTPESSNNQTDTPSTEAPESPTPPTRTWTLAEVRSPRMWATADLASASSADQVRYDPQQAADMFIVGAAAERENAGRLVLVTDLLWASDQITTYGDTIFGPALGFPDTARYPANAELFVNSVYWLSGLDHMIAASARTQRVPRIGAISDNTRTAYQVGLLLGLPGLVLATGLTVYLVRRSG